MSYQGFDIVKYKFYVNRMTLRKLSNVWILKEIFSFSQ